MEAVSLAGARGVKVRSDLKVLERTPGGARGMSPLGLKPLHLILVVRLKHGRCCESVKFVRKIISSRRLQFYFISDKNDILICYRNKRGIYRIRSFAT